MRILVAAVTALAMLSAAACHEDEPIVSVPQELIGTWLSDDPRYVGRSMEITNVLIVFGIDDARREVYVIEKIERAYDGLGTLYTLRYARQSGGRQLQIAFYWDRGILRLKNQYQVSWTRQGQT